VAAVGFRSMLDGQGIPRSLPASVALVFFGSFRARSTRTEAGGPASPQVCFRDRNSTGGERVLTILCYDYYGLRDLTARLPSWEGRPKGCVAVGYDSSPRIAVARRPEVIVLASFSQNIVGARARSDYPAPHAEPHREVTCVPIDCSCPISLSSILSYWVCRFRFGSSVRVALTRQPAAVVCVW
jgi:hypothetical protein